MPQQDSVFIDQGDVNLREIRELLGDIIADGRRASDVGRGIRGMVKKEQMARRSVDLNQVVVDALRMASPDALLHSCQLEKAGVRVIKVPHALGFLDSHLPDADLRND